MGGNMMSGAMSMAGGMPATPELLARIDALPPADDQPDVDVDRHVGDRSPFSLRGFAQPWRAVLAFCETRRASGAFNERRLKQDEAWMWERIEAGLHQRFREHAAVRQALPALSAEVRAGRVAASVAARQLLGLMN